MCWIMNWKWLLISCALSLHCCSPRAESDSFSLLKKTKPKKPPKNPNKTFKGAYEICSVIISKIKTPKKLPSCRNLVNLLVLWMKDATEILNIYCSCAKWPCTSHLNCTIIHQPSLLCLAPHVRILGVITSFFGWSGTYFLYPHFAFRQRKSQPNESSVKYYGALTLPVQWNSVFLHEMVFLNQLWMLLSCSMWYLHKQGNKMLFPSGL